MAIGAACAPFVKFMMYAMAPVAWPTAKLLDWCLGHDEGTTYRKAGELRQKLRFWRRREGWSRVI